MSMLAGWVILILTWIPNLKSHTNFTHLLLNITILDFRLEHKSQILNLKSQILNLQSN